MHTYAMTVECAMSCNFTAKCDEINDVYLKKMILQDFLWIFLMELKERAVAHLRQTIYTKKKS